MATTSAPVPALAWLPNGLTILRFLLIPAFIVVCATRGQRPQLGGGIIFGVAGITDQVDGWLARRWHVESEFGKYADPLADRLMIDTAVVMLVLADRLPWAALVVIVGRDAFLIVGDEGRRAARLRVLGQLPRQGGDVDPVRGRRVPARHRARAPAGRSWLFWIGLGMAVGAAVLYGSSAWGTIRRQETA